jgi:hypothetical protein
MERCNVTGQTSARARGAIEGTTALYPLRQQGLYLVPGAWWSTDDGRGFLVTWRPLAAWAALQDLRNRCSTDRVRGTVCQSSPRFAPREETFSWRELSVWPKSDLEGIQIIACISPNSWSRVSRTYEACMSFRPAPPPLSLHQRLIFRP